MRTPWLASIVAVADLAAATTASAQSDDELNRAAQERHRAGNRLGAAQLYRQLCERGVETGCERELGSTYVAVMDMYAATSAPNMNGVMSRCSDILNFSPQCEAPVARAIEMLRPLCEKAMTRTQSTPSMLKACSSWVMMGKHLEIIKDPEGALGFRRPPPPASGAR